MSTTAADIQALIEQAAAPSQSESAETALREAARNAAAAGLKRLEANALCELGCLLRKRDGARDEEALGHLHRALELSVASDDTRGQVAALTELGLHNFQSSDLAGALPFLHEAEQICKLAGMHTELADTYDLLGGVYYTMGQFETSHEYSLLSLEIASRLRDPDRLVNALDSLGSNESVLGRHESAFERFAQCVATIREMPEGRRRTFLEGVAQADWAEALCAAQRWQEAHDKARDAGDLASAVANDGLHGQALYVQGRALIALGNEEAAEDALERGRDCYSSSRNKYYRGKIERELSGIHRRRGDFQEALRFLDMALATEASMQREAAMHLGAQQRARERIDGLKREKSATERVLFNVLPDSIARRILAGAPRIADERPDVSVIFADVVGFTQLASRMRAGDLLEMLDRVFSHLDSLTQQQGLAKIKTIGDAYMAAGGVPDSQPDHLERCARLALAMRDTLGELNRAHGTTLALRIGMHAGPAVAGVIGSARLSYDLWGETVNIASRLESAGVPGRIHVSPQVRERLRSAFAFRPRGAVTLKGVGEMETYFLEAALQ